MVRRGLAAWLALLLVASLVPSAGSQALPEVAPGADHTIVSVEVPLAGAAGSGSLQVPVDGGVLDIHVDPILLPGPGGTVDVEAYLAEARLLLPSGVALPLPSMVIRSEDHAIDGPAAQALAELAAELSALRAELEALPASLEEPEGEPEPEAEPEPDGSDPMAPLVENLTALQAEAGALAAEAAWLEAMADEAAGAAGAGAAEQVAIAGAMLARVEAGLALLMDGMEAARQQADEAAAAAPDVPEAPAPSVPSGPTSSSASPSSSSSSSSSSSAPSPPEDPTPAEVRQAIEVLRDGLGEAQAQAERSADKAEAARDELGGTAGKVLGKVDGLVDEQGAIDGARNAVALAQQALADQRDGAQAKVAELQAELEAQAAGAQGDADQAALEAEAALEQAVADFRWATDWIAAAQAMGSSAGQESLADASRSASSAAATAEAVLAIVERYSSSQAGRTSGAMADELAAARQPLADAAAAAGSAQADLASALEALGSVPGGLEPLPEVPAPAAPGMPGAPSVSPMPGMPASFDAETLAVCVDSLAAQACFQYQSPVEAEPRSLTVLLAVPVGVGAPDLPGSLPEVQVPVPTPSVPSAPSVPVPAPGGLPGLPGGSSSASPSPSASQSSSAAGSASSSSSGGLLPGSSSSQSSGAAAPEPHLQASADRETLGLAMGEQGTIVLTVRNDGDAADDVRVTAQTDAPIAFDTTTESMRLAPGEEGTFTVRITPLSAGSGVLDLLATGDQAATAVDSVLVAVEGVPSPAPSASIAASIEPTALQSAIGQGSPVTIQLSNQGAAADLVAVEALGSGVQVEPSRLEVLLQPGESVARQVQVTPMLEGASQVVVRITSERGADLKPIVLLDGTSALDGPNPGPSDGQGESDASDSKDSPGAGLLLASAAVALALLGRRKLRQT